MDYSQWLHPPGANSLAAAAALMVGGAVAAWSAGALAARLRRKHSRSDNGSSDLPASLLDDIDKRQGDLAAINAHIVAMPLISWAAFLGLTMLRPDINHPAGRLALTAGTVVYVLIAAVRRHRLHRRHRLAQLRAENNRRTSKALAALAEQGYHLFQDVRHGTFHIDHLVVGGKGIFAVQVFTHPGRRRREDSPALVTYDGRALLYANRSDYGTITRARQQAESLSGWLTQHLDEPVAARAILAMPGWTIKRVSADGISVVNPSQFDSLFHHIQARPLSEAHIDAIVACLRHDEDNPCQ